jgi:hypothetical protein
VFFGHTVAYSQIQFYRTNTAGLGRVIMFGLVRLMCFWFINMPFSNVTVSNVEDNNT